MMGIFQLLFGYFKGHKLLKYVPPSAVSGFLIALAFMIAQGQIQHFQNNDELDNKTWMKNDQLITTSSLVILGIVFIIIFNILSNKYSKIGIIPPTIVSMLLVILVVYTFFNEKVNSGFIKTIKDYGDISLSWNSIKQTWFDIFSGLKNIETYTIIKLIPYSISMATAGLIESLLTVRRVSRMIGGSNEDEKLYKETFAQGIANIGAALFGGQGGCVLVGQTMLNISNGARTRWSSLTASVVLALLTIFASPMIMQIPMSALVSSMLYIVYQTGDWKALGNIAAKSDYLTTVATTLTSIITHNLAIGVIVGCVIHSITQNIK